MPNISVRDKKDATEFVRKIDRSHSHNIRVVIPPAIDEYLRCPDKVVFSLETSEVVVRAKDAKHD